MDRITLNERITEIGTCEDEARRRELLASLGEEIKADYDAHEELVTAHEAIINDNENLRATNMRLFLKIGDNSKDKTDPELEPETKEKLEFKNLFDEKGNLK